MNLQTKGAERWGKAETDEKSAIIIGAAYLVPQSIRTVFFHTNNFAIRDPVFSCRLRRILQGEKT